MNLTAWEPPTTWINLYEKDSLARIAAHEESHIDAAVTTYLDTGKDSLLHVEFVEGGEYCVRASQITSWYCNTAEFRGRSRALERMIEEEKKAEGWSE